MAKKKHNRQRRRDKFDRRYVFSIRRYKGPQGDDPVCPCRMRHMCIEGGRYKLVQDFGPVTKEPKPRKPMSDAEPWRYEV